MPKVLIIEDEPDIRNIIAESLTFEGFEVFKAENGLDGVTQAREHLPDVIVCDVMMPDMDGFGVLKELRSDSYTSSIPFIFLTAKTTKTDLRLGMESGADDYLMKPVKNNELLAAIRVRLQRKSSLQAEQLRALSHNLVRIQEEERRSLAHKLEGEIGQLLTGLKMTLTALDTPLPAESVQPLVKEAQRLASEVVEQVNTTALHLWPVMLDHLGLLPALLWQVEQFTEHTHSTIDFKHSPLDHPLDEIVKTTAFRIVQEILDTVVPDAEAHLLLRVWIESDMLNLSLEAPADTLTLSPSTEIHTGSRLIGLRERAQAVRGELTVTTLPNGATSVSVRLPVVAERAASLTAPPPVEHKPPTPQSPQVSRPDALSVPQSPRDGKPVRIALAVENGIIKGGLQRAFDGQPGYKLVGVVEQRRHLLNLIEDLCPDVLVMDLVMGGASNLEIISTARQINSAIKFLVVSLYNSEYYVVEALRQGANGYLLASSNPAELLKAVTALHQGERYLDGSLSAERIEKYLHHDDTFDPSLDSYSTLTDRERQVLQLVVEGNTNANIADMLTISPRTVETHRANMMRKLGLSNKLELIRYAMKHQLISVDRF